MRKLISGILLILLIKSSRINCSSSTTAESSMSDSTLIMENVAASNMAESISKFSLKLISIVDQIVPKNISIVISPYSIQAALSMLYLGAKGKTAKKLRKTLQLANDNTKGAVATEYYFLLRPVQNISLIHMANAIFVKKDYSIRWNYRNLAKTKFYSKVENVNFADRKKAATRINHWMSDKTDYRIRKIISPNILDKETRMIMINGIYFDGQWKIPFPFKNTVSMSFYGNGKIMQQIQMMNINHMFNYLRLESLNTSVIQLPYTNTEMSMLVFLPDDNDGLEEFESNLNTINFAKLESQMSACLVNISLPKFQIDFGIDLRKTLSKLGMSIIFDEHEANFEGMLGPKLFGLSSVTTRPKKILPPLYVSHMVHKTIIYINEIGTVGSIGSGVKFLKPGVGSILKTENFHADHSFFFIIMNLQDPLIMGRFVG